VRAGLRIQEALALAEHDIDQRRGSLLVRNGRADGDARSAWTGGSEQLPPWLNARAALPIGPLFCIIDGPTRGRPWSGAAARSEFRRLAARAAVRRRFAPHQLRHAHALELAREGVALNIIQRQLGHANLGTTSIYLTGHRPRRDHHGRARAPRADDVCQRRPAPLIERRRHYERERHGAPAQLWRSECLDGPTHTIEARPFRQRSRAPSRG
jgi:integrase